MLQTQLRAKSVALDTKTRELEILSKRMEDMELERKRQVDALQDKVSELQRQLAAAKEKST